jgi:hypothetical protein
MSLSFLKRQEKMNNQIKINPLKVGTTLFILTVILCIISMGLWYFPRKLLFQTYNLDELFSVDNEGNIPTYFNSFLLLIPSLFCYLVSRLKKGIPGAYYTHWLILAIGFFYMSLDESAVLHEKLITLTNRLITIKSDFLEYSWVIPGSILVVILFIYFLPFIKSLPRKTLWLFVISGSMYILGAIGFEMIGSFAHANFTYNSREYTVVVTIEEFLEMAGLSVFAYSLLDYLQSTYQSFMVVIDGHKKLPE